MNIVVLDLETEKDFREVGGKQNLPLLGVSVVGTYHYPADAFYAYEKEEFAALEKLLEESNLLVGFNVNHFDLPVLAPHVRTNLANLTVLDLMLDVEKSLGFRVSLDNLSRATLGAGKSGMGLEAIDWWRQGEKQKVKDYCLQDVRLTRDLYEFGKNKGYVVADTRDKGRVRVPVNWQSVTPPVRKVIEEALARRVTVEIEYEADDNAKQAVRQKVDVHALKGDSFDGFCYHRQGKRTFALDRVRGATLTEETYQLPNDVQQSLI